MNTSNRIPVRKMYHNNTLIHMESHRISFVESDASFQKKVAIVRTVVFSILVGLLTFGPLLFDGLVFVARRVLNV